jgi:hypothetical protein
LAVERVDSAGTPTGGAPGVDFALETKTSAVSPQHANPEQADDASALAKSLLDVTLVPETTVQSVPDVTLSPLVDQEVCSVKVVAPVYLDWSNKPITFDRADHPDHVPSLGKYPLVVDPVIGDVRLPKVLMDGGSSLNIIYAETLGLLRVDLSSVRAGAAPFHGIIPGKRVQPLGQLSTFPSASEHPPTSEGRP